MYTLKYFYEKFSKIPEERWMTGIIGHFGKHCAMGHCGVTSGIAGNWKHTAESLALMDFFEIGSEYKGEQAVYTVNDECYGHRNLGMTPKRRILNRILEIAKEIDVDLNDPDPADPVEEVNKILFESDKILVEELAEA